MSAYPDMPTPHNSHDRVDPLCLAAQPPPEMTAKDIINVGGMGVFIFESRPEGGCRPRSRRHRQDRAQPALRGRLRARRDGQGAQGLADEVAEADDVYGAAAGLPSRRANLLEPRHSDRFVTLLNEHYPTWREARNELNALPLTAEEWAE